MARMTRAAASGLPCRPCSAWQIVTSERVKVGCNETKERTLGVGQWGSNPYISMRDAEDVCQFVWGVQAQVAETEFC